MKHFSRRTFWSSASAALGAPLISRYAYAAEIKWRLGHIAPIDSPLHQRLLEAADAIGKRSDGRITLTIIGSGQAGIQSGLLSQVRGGSLEMTVLTCTQLAPTLDLCSIPSTGFLFGDYPSVWPVMDGELGQMIRAQISSDLGLEVLEKIWDFGFRQVTNSVRPILNANDIAGLKIRTQIDADQMDMFRDLNAVPVVITLPYLRLALEHHQIDGQEGMLPLVEYAHLSGVQPYCALTRHVWDGLWLCINPAAWKGLPDNLQRIVANTLNGAALHQREDSANMETSTRVLLTQAAMSFTDVDQGSFRDLLRVQGHYARIRMKLGEKVWNIVQKATGVTA